MASIDWTAPGDSIKGNTKAFRKLKGTASMLAKSFEFKNLKVIIKKSNPQIRTTYHRFQSSKSPTCNLKSFIALYFTPTF